MRYEVAHCQRLPARIASPYVSFAQLPLILLPCCRAGVIKAAVNPLSRHASRQALPNRLPARHLADVDNQPNVSASSATPYWFWSIEDKRG